MKQSDIKNFVGYTFADEGTARKKPQKDLDHLTIVAMEAKAAGMSYGKYVAMLKMQDEKTKRG